MRQSDPCTDLASSFFLVASPVTSGRAQNEGSKERTSQLCFSGGHCEKSCLIITAVDVAAVVIIKVVYVLMPIIAFIS